MKKVLFSLFLFTIFLFSVFGENSQSEKKSNDNLGFSAQLAISNSDYMVTVGDFYRLTYSISGNMISYEIMVDSTYDIRIGSLGVIKAKGKSYISLKKEVEELVLRNFPMSGVQFVLVSPAVFTVKITGEVNSATEKKVWGLTRVSEAISNSLTEYSSTRNIKIKPENGKVKVIDLFKASRNGDFTQNPYVRPGDEIIVQRMERKVSISGEVERPGTYELLPGENLKELVEKYGNGLTEFANTEKIGLVRQIGSETKSGDKIYIDESAITQNYKLNNGDSIEVTSLKTLKPTIIVEGIVADPKAGEDSAETAQKNSVTPIDTSYKTYVRFYTGENYATLIRRISSMFNSYSDLKNAYIERNGERISLDIEHILYDAELMSDKTVMANDRLVIPYQQHLQKVLITGEVKKVVEENAWPLRRLSAIIGDNLTPYSSTRNVIVRTVEGTESVYDLFEASRNGDLTQNPYIRSGETIIVQRMERKVSISGEVERPGTYELLPGENLKELVEKYGNGLTEFANTEKIGLVRRIGSETKSGDKIYIDESAIAQNYKLNNGDSVEVTSLKTLMPTIIVEGIIANPKSEEDSAETAKKGSAAPLDTSYKTYVRFYTGENYATLIRRISGMFNSYSDLKNAYIERNGEKISLDIEHILYDAELMSDKTVMANDRLVIPYQQHLQKVLITGEVKKVVEENAWPLRRLSAIIGDNLTPYSSTRNVIVRTVEGTESVYDLFEASRNGDLAQNPYIRSGETIIVQRMERKVSISGEVERPGTYELLPGENLKELVEKYGNGLTEFADLSRIEVFRVKSENSVSGQMMYLNAQDLEDEVLTTFDVQCYDSVTVMSFKNLKPVVFIEGAVLSDTNKSGTELLSSNKLSINFEIDTNYAFFVRSNRKIFSSVSDLKNAYIKRGQDIIPIDLEKILYDKSYYSELIVENGDTLLVPFRQFFVTVSGAVNNPGRYPYIPDRTYEYYVGLAGGFIKSQNSGDAVRLTDVNGKHFSKKTVVPPEAMIEAKTNSFLYYFNQVGGVVTTLVSIVLSSLTLLVTLGVF